MNWFKRNLRKIGIIVTAGLLLAWAMWISFSVLGTQIGRAPAMNTGTVQATPTVDVTAVVQDQLKQQDEKLQRDNSFPWIIWNTVGGSTGTILVAAAALIAAWLGWRQWLTNRRDEQLKRAEERFQKVVEGFGGDNEGAKVGAAILLRTFLRPGYEQFYAQTFDLAVANLRLPRTPHASEDPDGVPYQPKDHESPLPLTTLSQALIVVFKEAFPLVRNTLIREKKGDMQSLDAANIQLDNAFLPGADLKSVWIPQALLRKAVLIDADLTSANLYSANLYSANLSIAHLSFADLRDADLRDADLWGATLTGANPEDAHSLEGTKLYGVKGLDEKQLAECELKGAFIDKDSTTSLSQSTASPSPILPSNNAQTPLASSAQEDLPGSDAGSSAASSKPDPEP